MLIYDDYRNKYRTEYYDLKSLVSDYLEMAECECDEYPHRDNKCYDCYWANNIEKMPIDDAIEVAISRSLELNKKLSDIELLKIIDEKRGDFDLDVDDGKDDTLQWLKGLNNSEGKYCDICGCEDEILSLESCKYGSKSSSNIIEYYACKKCLENK